MAACSAGTKPGAGREAAPPGPVPDPAGTVWLCRPGQAPDPCASSLAATVVPASGRRRVIDPVADGSSPFDCFYVYPTVSPEAGENADLKVQPAETEAAESQASQFSTVCRVWAPIYRQITVAGLFDVGQEPAGIAVAYRSLLVAWQDYLARYNGGRPIVFLGHSQGSALLIRLLQSQVDPDPGLRGRTVTAIVAGGNVVVPTGATAGGSFDHLPLCTASSQYGCVVAYSTFPGQPPPGAFFGRPGLGVSYMAGQEATAGLQVACTNPAALGGGTADLSAMFPAGEFPPSPPAHTPWVIYPDLYSASCRSAGGATWLQVTTLDTAGRPTVRQDLGPQWGYHVYDVNLPLGNLVADVAAAERGWAARR